MRTWSAIRLVLLFPLLLSAGRAYGQPMNPAGSQSEARWLVDTYEAADRKWSFTFFTTAGSTSWDAFDIDSDIATSVQKQNGVTVGTQTQINTPRAQQDLTFSMFASGVDVGSSVRLAPWVILEGSLHLGSVELSYEDPQRAETTYEGADGVAGFDFGIAAALDWDETVSVEVLARFDRRQGTDATRTPAQSGPVVTERNEFNGDFLLTCAEAAFFRKASQRLGLSVSAGGGYMWSDVRLERELLFDFSQTLPLVTLETNTLTDLSKHGLFGTVGAGVSIGPRFSVFVRGSFGAQSGVSIGGAVGFP